MNLPYYDAATVRATLPFDRAITAIESGLRDGIDPEVDSPRLFSPAPDGEFLLMPAVGKQLSGLKVATIAPNNPAKNLEKIQGVYLLFASDSLSPVAAMDAASLTAIRTPATTLAAVRNITAASTEFPAAPNVLVFGAGVQALNHIRAARAAFPEATFAVVGRRSERVAALIAELDVEGIYVARSGLSEVPGADIILCVTSSPTPVFDGALVAEHAVVASVGQHGLSAREVDAALVLRSDVVVEGRESSWRESGNLAQVRSEEQWRQINPPNVQDLVCGRFTRTLGKPTLYTGVGMAWEDLVIASVVYEECTGESQ